VINDTCAYLATGLSQHAYLREFLGKPVGNKTLPLTLGHDDPLFDSIASAIRI
jgi:hypothetical protein